MCDPAPGIPFHKAFLKYLKSTTASPLQLWKAFWCWKQKQLRKLVQTWKVTQRWMEGRAAEIWELHQKNDFIYLFIFKQAFVLVFYTICLCSAPSALSHIHGSGVQGKRHLVDGKWDRHTQRCWKNQRYHTSNAVMYCKRQLRAPLTYSPMCILVGYLHPQWVNKRCLGNRFNRVCKQPRRCAVLLMKHNRKSLYGKNHLSETGQLRSNPIPFIP